MLVVAHGIVNSYLINELLKENKKTLKFKPQTNDEIHYVKVGKGPPRLVLNWKPY